MSVILLPPSHDSRIPLRLLPLSAHLSALFCRVPATLSASTCIICDYLSAAFITIHLVQFLLQVLAISLG